MTINHIDQLAQWYADAEQITKTNPPRAGDTLILPYNAGGYGVEVEENGWTSDDVVPGEPVRILARAPKPKPAWHNAAAVIADADQHQRQVWVRESDGTYGCSEGYVVDDYELHDVTPLIEAKVTDEMVERLESRFNKAAMASLPTGLARRMLTVALGLETE